MRNIVSLFIIGMVGLVPHPVSIAAERPSEADHREGVWEGMLGDQPIRACFVGNGNDQFGAYFYLSHPKLISLSRDADHPNSFTEPAPGEIDERRWTIGHAGEMELDGRWTSGNRSFPIRLRRLHQDAEDPDSACASGLFHEPRLREIGTVPNRETKDGVGYTRLVFDPHGFFPTVKVETFKLDGNAPGISRINETLARPLSADRFGWSRCMRSPLNSMGHEGEVTETITPLMISRRWLSIEHYFVGYCDSPEISISLRTFELSTGEEIDPIEWLNDAAILRKPGNAAYREVKTLRPDFIRFILKNWKPNNSECADDFMSADIWNLGLTRSAMVFMPNLPPVARICTEGVSLSLTALAPYLTTEGKGNIASIMEERVSR